MGFMEQYKDLYKLDGKVALVAGGYGGIGSAVCEGLAAFGATAIVWGRDQEKAGAVAEKINAGGGKAQAVFLDAADVPGINNSVAGIVKEHGSADILINCVGSHIEAPAEEYKEEDWDKIMSLNLKSAFFLSQAVAKVQIAAKSGGKHVHVTSVRSVLALRRGFSSYCSSKGGMNMMVKQTATEWAKYGICVNGVAPTFTRTELVKKYLDDPAFYDPLVARIPLGRICEPSDLGALMVYLSAPASDFITGQIIIADGGITACQ